MPSRFEMTCSLSVPVAIDRIKGLLIRKGVKVQTSGPNIQSLEIPIILWNWSRLKFSRSNWVGLNPFIQISQIEIQAQPYQGTGSKLSISLNQLRGYGYVALSVLVGLSVAVAPPVPTPVKIVFVIVFPCIYWLFQVPLIRHLVRKEMQNELME